MEIHIKSFLKEQKVTMPAIANKPSYKANLNSVPFNREYWLMVEQWTDDACADLELELLLSSGNEFRTIALTRSSSEVFSECYDADSETEDVQPFDAASPPPSEKRALSGGIASQQTFLTVGSQETELDKQNSSEEEKSRITRRLIAMFALYNSLAEKIIQYSRRASLLPDTQRWPAVGNDLDGLLRDHNLIKDRTFNALDWSPDDLTVIVADMFIKMEHHKYLKISQRTTQNFFLSVCSLMLDNPYHNWTHVVDVLQTVHNIASLSGILEMFGPKQQLALFLAAVCHDLEHPGVSADYLVRSNSKLAALYRNDPGLLEKHHTLRAFELMICSECALFHAIPDHEKKEIVDIIRELIVATDMSKHKSYSQLLEDARIANLSTNSFSGMFSQDCDAHMLLMKLLLKCADLSNVFKPFSIAKEWAVCVTDEFFSQGDLERFNRLDITPMCDRDKQSRVALQKGFIDHVVYPFVKSLTEIFPRMAPILSQLQENRKGWDTMTDDRLLEEVHNIRAVRQARWAEREDFVVYKKL